METADAILIPVYDWEVKIRNHFDQSNQSNYNARNKTFSEMGDLVETLRKRYPDAYVFARATNSEKVNFISTQPLNMEKDERSDMDFDTWVANWYEV